MAECVTKVELSVSCADLLDKDVGSKSDPLCVLLQNTGGDHWAEVTWQSHFMINECYFGDMQQNNPHPTPSVSSWVALSG